MTGGGGGWNGEGHVWGEGRGGGENIKIEK